METLDPNKYLSLFFACLSAWCPPGNLLPNASDAMCKRSHKSTVPETVLRLKMKHKYIQINLQSNLFELEPQAHMDRLSLWRSIGPSDNRTNYTHHCLVLNISVRTIKMFGGYQIGGNETRTTFKQRAQQRNARLKSSALYVNTSDTDAEATHRMERLLRWQRREANNGQANLIIASYVGRGVSVLFGSMCCKCVTNKI